MLPKNALTLTPLAVLFQHLAHIISLLNQTHHPIIDTRPILHNRPSTTIHGSTKCVSPPSTLLPHLAAITAKKSTKILANASGMTDPAQISPSRILLSMLISVQCPSIALPSNSILLSAANSLIVIEKTIIHKLPLTLFFSVFFTHCHPARAIIHKPTFAAALGHNRVPAHLLHAVCALAAPLSKQPKIRTSPSRFAGKPFAQEALSLMFDNTGRLIVEPNLATAQALCLLQMHDVLTADKNTIWPSRYHGIIFLSTPAAYY